MSADLLCGTGFSLCAMTTQRKAILRMKPMPRETRARISRNLLSGSQGAILTIDATRLPRAWPIRPRNNRRRCVPILEAQ